MVWVGAVSSVPAHRSKVPGSMDQWWVVGLQKPRSLVLRAMVTVRVSLGLRLTRTKPLSSRTGREALPARWWV